MKKWILFIIAFVLIACVSFARPPVGAVFQGEYGVGEKIYEYRTTYTTSLFFQGYTGTMLVLFALTSPDNPYEVSRERFPSWVPLSGSAKIGDYWFMDLGAVELYLVPVAGTRIQVWTI